MTMNRYRKKPVTVDAWRITKDNVKDVAYWCDGALERSIFFDGRPDEFRVHITTLEGVMVAEQGDWVIRGVKGEFYPCKHDIFIQTYDEMAYD